ncbi:DUF4012 domain-containing protein [Microbacterium sp. MEC084]|uniref:DUF4012 domain-containing protein n=1 Tax=Microbacterium sp. MEC084 TaxID=1963027 RepID=UPI0014307FF0|nr:DUF4012 domain-containing protein [Microbacterium sp. MEC084]MCD1269649.1 DUF4012 domain-containing protein [Microbacterium sp. MEC084]
MTVKNELEASRAVIADVQADRVSVTEGVEVLTSHSARAAEAAADPIWRMFEVLPFLGENLRAVRLASESVDVLARQVAEPLVSGSDGSVVQRLLDVTERTGARISLLASELQGATRSSTLIGPVRDGVSGVADVMATMAPVMELAPPMLGAEGPRNYLLVFQNNAEAVGLGGSAAAQTLVAVDNGALSLRSQANSGSYATGQAVDADVPRSAIDLYSNYLIDHINTSASRPDFPTMANILIGWWQRDISDDRIDGVVSIDPIALARVLRATGPIALPTGDELNESNAVDLLLHDIYMRWGSYEEAPLVDAFFAGVAGLVFEKVATGAFDLQDMAWALREGIDEGNIMFYSTDERIQREIAPLRVSGILPNDNTVTTTAGVYFRDESTSKIDYYMSSAIDLSERCSDGMRFFTVQPTLKLDLSQAEADMLPQYIRSGRWGSAQFRTQVYVYGPPGTAVESVSVDGRDVRVVRDDVTDLERPVAWFETNLAPGEAATVSATFAGPEAEYGPLEIRSTPMINKTPYSTSSEGCRGR